MGAASRKSNSVDTLRQILAKNIRAFRRDRGLSQEELADQCGYHRTYIGSVERCERNVSLSTLESLAVALNTTVQALLTDIDENN